MAINGLMDFQFSIMPLMDFSFFQFKNEFPLFFPLPWDDLHVRSTRVAEAKSYGK